MSDYLAPIVAVLLLGVIAVAIFGIDGVIAVVGWIILIVFGLIVVGALIAALDNAGKK